MPFQTAAQQAERDKLVAGLLLPDGISEYELARALRDRLGLPVRGRGGWKGLGHASLRRLEQAGRARCETEPHGNPAGYRRVWYPVSR